MTNGVLVGVKGHYTEGKSSVKFRIEANDEKVSLTLVNGSQRLFKRVVEIVQQN